VALQQKVRELNGGDEMTRSQTRDEDESCSFFHGGDSFTHPLTRSGVCGIIEMEVIGRTRETVMGRNLRTVVFCFLMIFWKSQSNNCHAGPKILLPVLLYANGINFFFLLLVLLSNINKIQIKYDI